MMQITVIVVGLQNAITNDIPGVTQFQFQNIVSGQQQKTAGAFIAAKVLGNTFLADQVQCGCWLIQQQNRRSV